MSKIKVLVIDDSAVVRQVLTGIINDAAGMEVIGIAQDPIFALQKLTSIKPDVITLDVEMPRMDGLTFLEKLMRENPIPVVMCSTLTQKSSATSIRALHLGALEIVAKPTSNLKSELKQQGKMIVDSIRTASKARIGKLKTPSVKASVLNVDQKRSADVILPKQATVQSAPSPRVVAIGASTGGTQALEYVLSSLKTDVPGVVIVQHMPEAFTEAFSQRLDKTALIDVKQAADGDLVETGKALVAPGGKHMIVENHSGKLYVSIKQGPPVSRHCPSVDVLFRSVAQNAAKQSLGIIMTGMGDDGANGMKEMHDAGAFTVAQDEDSCVIFGMPAVAIERGGVKKTASLEVIPEMINAFDHPLDFKKFV